MIYNDVMVLVRWLLLESQNSLFFCLVTGGPGVVWEPGPPRSGRREGAAGPPGASGAPRTPRQGGRRQDNTVDPPGRKLWVSQEQEQR